MKRRATLLAVGCAVLGALALHVYLSRFELELAGGVPRAVLVATRDLAAGEVLTRAALDYRDLPERYLEDRHIDGEELERLLGSRVRTAVSSGACLLWTDLALSRDPRTLAGLVQTGMRAFALPEHGLSFDGLLRPGDRVDVLFTRDDVSTTLLQNVLVLTIGTDLGNEIEPTRSSHDPSGRVTLSVALEQAQLLARSEGRGALRLALRNPQDLMLADPRAPAREGESVLLSRSEPLAGRPLRGEP
ncbi:MAG: Flp pilus assembly protein RcpC/CpaB [Myxococcaceae bacterium]|nr:Flp pilus assembly protein RcpC/CpaB [Myxococcaceae bacterium]